jgi:glycosyltransferase involved in cell wall biosynthesis
MNILFYCRKSRYGHRAIGGAEVSLQLIAEKLAGGEANVYFGTEDVPDVASFGKKRINGVEVYSLQPMRLWDKAATLMRGRVPSKDSWRRRFLAHIVKTERIDLVYAYDTIRDVPNLLKARAQYGLDVKIVKRMAGLFWLACIENGRARREQIEWAINSVDAVNYLTPAFKELVLQKARQHHVTIAPKREFIHDIGTNLDLFRYRWMPRQDRGFRIVSVSRFSGYQKRQDILIDCLSKLLHTDVTVEFLGVGDTMNSCRTRCQEAGLSDRVTFHGFCDQERLPHILEQADLFVLATNYEGLPKSLLEAMAIGTPCLVSDVVPLNRYIEDGVTGYRAGNTPEKWAAKIDFIIRERYRSGEISRQARKFIEHYHDADENVIGYHEQFEALITEEAKRSNG